MSLWYCAQTYFAQEAAAEANLRQRGFRTFSPSYLIRRAAPDYHIDRRLLFRGYIFVALDDPEIWPVVHRSRGVHHLMTQPPRPDADPDEYRLPTVVDEHAMTTLYDEALAHDEVRRGGGKFRHTHIARTSDITKGCHVRILSGPWQPFSVQEPVVDWSDGHRAALMLALFGRDTRVEFYHKDLERIADA